MRPSPRGTEDAADPAREGAPGARLRAPGAPVRAARDAGPQDLRGARARADAADRLAGAGIHARPQRTRDRALYSSQGVDTEIRPRLRGATRPCCLAACAEPV